MAMSVAPRIKKQLRVRAEHPSLTSPCSADQLGRGQSHHANWVRTLVLASPSRPSAVRYGSTNPTHVASVPVSQSLSFPALPKSYRRQKPMPR